MKAFRYPFLLILFTALVTSLALKERPFEDTAVSKASADVNHSREASGETTKEKKPDLKREKERDTSTSNRQQQTQVDAEQSEETNSRVRPAVAEMEAWLSESEELARFETSDPSMGKQKTVRLVRTDFKYPLVRVEEVASTGLATGKASAQRNYTAMVGDHLTVGLKADADMKQFTAVLSSMGMDIRNKLNEETFIVSFEPSEEGDALLEKQELLKDYGGLIAYVEPDYIVQSHVVPTDPFLLDEGHLWGLYNDGRFGGDPISDIDAENGWKLRKDAPNTIVAVIDTGVRRTHEKLAPNMWVNAGESLNGLDDDGNGYVDDLFGFDAYDNDMDPLDENGHGTHVAGIIGASGYNTGGILGVAWDVQIMGLRFLGPRGFGVTSDAVRCIDYAQRNGARILNNSWGGRGKSHALEAAIQRCAEDNILFVTSAGNANVDIDVQPLYPAAYPNRNIISVAAHDRKDEPAFFTNRGFQKVDISAPGVDIRSAAFFSDTATKRLSGTSMAAPFVSGILALLDAEFPNSENHQLLNRLYRGAGKMDPLHRHISQTGSRADLYGSLMTSLDTPPNDHFENASKPPKRSWAVWEIDSRGATFESEEPAYTRPAQATGSLWFKFDAQNTDAIRISTENSAYPTEIFVFDSNTRQLLASSNGQSRFYFEPEMTGSYHFAAVNATAASGLVALDIRQAPQNDRRTNAYLQEGLFWEAEGENGGATLDFDEFNTWGYAPVGRSVWWKWVAPRSGRFTLSTYGSEFDTVLSAFRSDDNVYLKDDTTHLLFIIDRSKALQKKYNVILGFDWNRDGGSPDLLDQQIGGIISAVRYWQFENKHRNSKWDNLNIGILVFDETAGVVDLNPATPEVEVWTGVTADKDGDGQYDIIQALRSIRSSELQADFEPALQSAISLLESAQPGAGVCAFFSPALDLAETDITDEVATFKSSGHGLTAFGPSIGSNIEALLQLDPYAKSYTHYNELRGMLRGMLAVNDDVSWYGRWSQITISATEGETYYFGVAGYSGEYGKIKLKGRDPDFPFIEEQPKSQEAGIGERVSIEVTASGQEPLLYQWYLDEEPIVGATRRNYAIWNALPADAGRYRVEVSNVQGAVLSETVQISLKETAPRITFQPSDTGFIENDSLRLIAAAVGMEPITWQWFHNGSPVSGQTSPILDLASATSEDAGEYHVVATNLIGSTRSARVEATRTSDEFGDWKLRAGSASNDLNAVTFGNDYFIAVGNNAEVLYTEDVITWRQAESNVESDLQGIAYGNGTFVAAGTNGIVMRGTSPHNLEQVSLEVTTDWNDVDFVDGVFWVTGNNGSLVRSLDGENWETISTETEADLGGITYGHDGYLVISKVDTYLRSANAIDWSVHTADSSNSTAVAFREVTYFDNHYYLCINGAIQTSSSTLLPVLSTSTSTNIHQAFASNGTGNSLIAVGGSRTGMGCYLFGKGGKTASGRVSISGGASAVAAAHGMDYYVSVGAGGQIFRSADGITWESGWEITSHDFNHIVYASGTYVATSNKGVVYSSPDGSWWQRIRGEVDTMNGDNPVVYHNGFIYVFTPSGYNGRTVDGINWEWFSGIGADKAFSDGTHIYASNNGSFFRSTDMREDYTTLVPFDSYNKTMNYIGYGNGIYLMYRTHAVWSANELWISNDGLNWTLSENGNKDHDGEMLVHGDGVFLTNNMRWSSDGQTWQQAGVLKDVPKVGSIYYDVPVEEDSGWANPGIGYSCCWASMPVGTVMGYDLNNLLSFPIDPEGDLSELMHDQLPGLYVRYTPEPLDDYVSLTLKTRFNDGLLVYVANSVVAASNANESATWASLAKTSKSISETEQEMVVDLSGHLDVLNDYSGGNMIAFHVLNHDPSDGLFLFDFNLVGHKRLDLENVFAADGTFFGFDAAGQLYVSENALDWVEFSPSVGVLNDIISDPTGYTGVGENGTVFQTGNVSQFAPQVLIREPFLPQNVGIGETIHFEIDAYASEGDITNVQLLFNDTVIATLTEAPYTYDWIAESFGIFEFYTIATDGLGRRSRSDSVEVSVAARQPLHLLGTNNSLGEINNLQRIGDQWAAPSTSGRIYFSSDGLTWITRTVPADDSIQSIAMAEDGTLVAGSAEGGIFISYDEGRNWIEQDRFLNFDLSSIEYRFGRFYFATNGLLITSSEDYLSWSVLKRFSGDLKYAPIGHFAFGNGKLMLAMNHEVYFSEDGLDWSLYGTMRTSSYSYRPRGATGLAYSSADGHFYTTYYSEGEVNGRTSYQVSIARLIPDQMAEEVLDLSYPWNRFWRNDHSPFHLQFNESGVGLLIGSRAAVFDPSAGIWQDTDSFSLRPTSAESRYTQHKALSHLGSDFYLFDTSDRILRSPDGVAWETLGGDPVNRWQAIRYLNGRYFALGLGGVIYSSTDTETWSRHSTGTNARLFDISYGNGRYVVAGSSGRLITSTDLTNWAIFSSGTPGDFQAVHFANDQFIAAGVDSAYGSTDGLDWVDIAPVLGEEADGYSLLSVRYWNDKWFLIGGEYTESIYFGKTLNAPLYYISENNGSSWIKGTYDGEGGSNDAFKDLIYANGSYLMTEDGSRMHVSPDLENWTIVAGEGGDVKDASYFDGYWYVMCAGGQLIRSQDKIVWETLIGAQSPTNVDYPAGAGPAAGPAGILIANGLEEILRSFDGELWEPVWKSLESRRILSSTIKGNDFWAINNLGEIVLITPGAQPLIKRAADSRFSMISEENGLLFAYGERSIYIDGFLVSSDGEEWTEVDLSHLGANADILSVTHDGTQYIAMAVIYYSSTTTAYALTSEDGMNWSLSETMEPPYGSARSGSVHYVNDAYFGSGLRRSTDMVNWVSVAYGSGLASSALGYVNGLYLYGGGYSYDGVDWQIGSGWTSANQYAYSHGIYGAIKDTTFYLSENGIGWSSSETGGIKLVNLMASEDGFVALADDGNTYEIPLTDLAVNDVEWDKTIVGPGESNTGRFHLTNFGRLVWNGTAEIAYEVWVTKSGTLYDASSRSIGSGTWSGNLAPSESGTVPIEVDIPDDLEAGEYYTAIVLDPSESLPDFNRDNNTRIMRLPDLNIPTWDVDFQINGGGAILSANQDSNGFRHNTTETFVPMAQKGYVFSGWEGTSDPGLGPLTLNFNQNHTVQAVFERAFQLNASTSGLGSVNASPGGEQFVEGSTVLLSPEPETGWRFEKWTGDAEGSNVPYTWNVDGDLRIKAHFIPDGSESFDAWISSRADSPKRDPNDDGLGNGRANIINYFLGQHDGNAATLNPTLIPTPVGYELNVPINPNAQDVGFEVLYSKDMEQWFTLEAAPDHLVSEGHSELSYEINKSGDKTLFFTVRVYMTE